MKYLSIAALLIVSLAGAAIAQQKPWHQWEKKDVDKMLNSSPWGQSQVETDTSQMTFSPTTDKQPLSTDGARNQAIDLTFRIRLFSARPIREAFARRVLMANPNIKPEQLNGFLNGDYSDSIVVAVATESTDRRLLGPVNQKLEAATTETLKNNVYLERADGKRVILEEYARPTTDGTGAKFVFPRLIDDKPFLGPTDSFRFVADLGRGTKIEWRFKLSEMNYNGQLEY